MNGKLLKKEYGDYQTPINFAYKICLYLKEQLKINPDFVLEPTCGVGNFIKASMDTFENINEMYGIDINDDYCKICLNSLNDNRVKIFCENFFSIKIQNVIKHRENVLVIGNPPWATNSDLKFNLPQKSNFKRLQGTEAITGASNFDICEYIILKLLNDFENTNATIALLCKTTVARNVFVETVKNNYSLNYIKIIEFDAKKIFGVSVSACLLIIKVSKNGEMCDECYVSNIENPDKTISKIKYNNGLLMETMKNVYDLAGCCQYEWRQGVKHDCSKVMELEKINSNTYINKKKEKFEIEDTFVFPLIKSSNFKKAIIKNDFEKYVLVTQKKARDDTFHIRYSAPLTWNYLQNNKELFDNRKSVIYNGTPPFSMFGIGAYSYAKYKVGISGFYKKPLFSLLYNEYDIEKPIMLDDTSYFLSFDDYDAAYVHMLLLNSEAVQEFLMGIVFKDSKRPYTKRILQKIDFKKCFEKISISELRQTERKLNIDHYINENLYRKVRYNLK